MATTNASADEVRVALKPYTTSLKDEDIEFRIEQGCHVVNGRLGTDYTASTEDLYVKHAIIFYTVFIIIDTVFFDETLSTVSWRFNDIEMEHAQHAFAIRDFALANIDLANTILSKKGITVLSYNSYKEWETKKAGRPDGYYYGDDGVIVD